MKQKESKAELVKRLEKAFAIEDKYFPGYLGNPQTLGAFVAGIPRMPAKRAGARTRRHGARKNGKG